MTDVKTPFCLRLKGRAEVHADAKMTQVTHDTKCTVEGFTVMHTYCTCSMAWHGGIHGRAAKKKTTGLTGLMEGSPIAAGSAP